MNIAPEDHLYFYHPDHLGSSSWITYTDGEAIQHLNYLPFGECFIDQRINSFGSRYTFSTKEKDVETGYGYFGARYYSSDLSIWLSVDPMSDKYPSISPYVYCADNPVKLVDPNGEEVVIVGDQAETAFNSLQSGTNLKLSMDENGRISATGKPTNRADKKLLKAISHEKISAKIDACNENNYNEGGASYCGTEYNNESRTAISSSYINILTLSNFESINEAPNGSGIIHEITEGFNAGIISIKKGKNISEASGKIQPVTWTEKSTIIKDDFMSPSGKTEITTSITKTQDCFFPDNKKDYRLYQRAHNKATKAPNEF